MIGKKEFGYKKRWMRFSIVLNIFLILSLNAQALTCQESGGVWCSLTEECPPQYAIADPSDSYLYPDQECCQDGKCSVIQQAKEEEDSNIFVRAFWAVIRGLKSSLNLIAKPLSYVLNPLFEWIISTPTKYTQGIIDNEGSPWLWNFSLRFTWALYGAVIIYILYLILKEKYKQAARQFLMLLFLYLIIINFPFVIKSMIMLVNLFTGFIMQKANTGLIAEFIVILMGISFFMFPISWTIILGSVALFIAAAGLRIFLFFALTSAAPLILFLTVFMLSHKVGIYFLRILLICIFIPILWAVFLVVGTNLPDEFGVLGPIAGFVALPLSASLFFKFIGISPSVVPSIGISKAVGSKLSQMRYGRKKTEQGETTSEQAASYPSKASGFECDKFIPYHSYERKKEAFQREEYAKKAPEKETTESGNYLLKFKPSTEASEQQKIRQQREMEIRNIFTSSKDKEMKPFNNIVSKFSEKEFENFIDHGSRTNKQYRKMKLVYNKAVHHGTPDNESLNSYRAFKRLRDSINAVEHNKVLENFKSQKTNRRK